MVCGHCLQIACRLYILCRWRAVRPLFTDCVRFGHLPAYGVQFIHWFAYGVRFGTFADLSADGMRFRHQAADCVQFRQLSVGCVQFGQVSTGCMRFGQLLAHFVQLGHLPQLACSSGQHCLGDAVFVKFAPIASAMPCLFIQPLLSGAMLVQFCRC